MSIPSARSSTDAADATRLTVVKLGGSLLDLPDLLMRLKTVLTDIVRPVIVVGGGKAADQVRIRDAALGLSDVPAHELAIAAMSLNARQLCQADTGLKLVSTSESIHSTLRSGDVPVVDALAVLKLEEQSVAKNERLPASWDVTSDSIAAWLAVRWNADLVMLKSVDEDSDAHGIVDPWFERTAKHVRNIRWINLRIARFQRCAAGNPDPANYRRMGPLSRARS